VSNQSFVELKEDFKLNSLSLMAQMHQYLKNQHTIALDKDEQRLLLMSSYLFPLVKYMYTVKKKPVPVIKYIILESLKLPTKDAEIIYLLCSSVEECERLVNISLPSRKEIGLFMRKVGALWKQTAILSLTLHLPPFKKDLLAEPLPESANKIISQYLTFIDNAENKLNLNGVWDLKHLLNGVEITSWFNQHRPKEKELSPGPWLAKILDKQLHWQLENPDSGVEACKQYLLSLNDTL